MFNRVYRENTNIYDIKYAYYENTFYDLSNDTNLLS
jgi:hypothetical protein